jgi:putative glycoside hydrolase with GxGYxYP motif/GxGYxY motif-containing protein
MRISLRANRLLAPVAVLALGLTAVSGTAQAGDRSSTALWPRFSTPQTVMVADATGLSNDDLLTATTLQGVYNGSQQKTRLYLNYRPEDDFWQTQIPARVRVESMPPPSGESLVQQLIERYRSAIRGAVVTNPANADTVNLATTMAGVDRAIVITPAQQDMVTALGIPILYSFDTTEFTDDDPVQTYQWGVDHLLPQTSTRILTMLPGSHGPDRDYAVATKSFVFSLTSTNTAQKAMMETILAHTPANTPIMGYVPNENPDVAYLSSLGHFLNASDNLSNGSVWASMPSPASLHQPTEPAPIAAKPDTVYIAFVESDGDNAQYMEHRMAQVWQGPDLDAVPEGWTIVPGTVDFAPTLLQYYADHLPGNSELVSGPSGIGYATQMSGANLTRFAQLSGDIMRRDDLKTVDNFQALGYLDQYAQDSGVPSISSVYPLQEKQIGGTVAIGQSSGYVKAPQALFCTIDQQRRTLRPGAPLFLEPMVDAWTLAPSDLLHIAQQLALAAQSSGLHYVFTTPTELALTMKRYHAGQEAGLPAGNAQSMTGEQALAKPIAGPPYPSNPVQVTGDNVVTNPSGASGTDGWTTSGGSVTTTTYQGKPALRWDSDVTTGSSWVHYYPAVQNGQTYTFSADVAGSGQVYLDVYDGTTDWSTLPVRLSSQYQTLTWTVTIPSNAPGGQTGNAPQLQIRSSGAAPVSVDVANASVATSTAAC